MDLKGKTILTTRAASQSGELRSRLESLGARVIECPTIEIVPVDDWSLVDASIRRLSEYQWLLFTSANAVDLFMKRVQLLGAVCKLPLGVVGKATAQRLREWNLEPAVIPGEFRAEGLLDAMPQELSGISILLPRAENAREILPSELRRRGARVDVVTIYRTIKGQSMSIADLIAAERVDCIVFTSPSTIRFLAESSETSLPSLLKGVSIAVIGPVTREAAVAYDLKVDIMPSQATIDDLVAAIAT